jgi:hypothetical protein
VLYKVLRLVRSLLRLLYVVPSRLSEVRKTHTNPSALARVVVLELSGTRVLRDHTNRDYGVAATVYQMKRGSHHFNRKLDSEDDVEHPRGGRK